MALVTLIFGFLTLKLVCESRQRWGTFVPNMSTLGLWVLGVIRYVRDGLTDESKPYCPLPYGRGHNNCNNHDNVDRATHSTTFTS